MENEYWNKEEFEDTVARSIIGMYETKIKKHKNSLKATRVTDEILSRIRHAGCYFSGNDRICAINENDNGIALAIQEIDVINDGRPEIAVMTHSLIDNKECEKKTSMRYKCYLENSYMERIKELPKPYKCDHSGQRYRIVKTWVNNDGFLEGICQYVVIDHDGKIYGTYWYRNRYDDNFFSCRRELVDSRSIPSEIESYKCEDIMTIEACMTIQAYQDRRYIWNVTAKEGIAKATFGVYPEEVKSLFYSREMPMTETGRKRPILHWVAAHRRRMKNGIDIDIEKYLRGTNEFIYNGTKFIITRPVKNGNIKL